MLWVVLFLGLALVFLGFVWAFDRGKDFQGVYRIGDSGIIAGQGGGRSRLINQPATLFHLFWSNTRYRSCGSLDSGKIDIGFSFESRRMISELYGLLSGVRACVGG